MITIKIEQHTGRGIRLGQKMQIIDPVIDIASAMRKRPVAEKLRGRQQHRLKKGNAGTNRMRRIGQQRMQPRDMCAEPTLIAVPPLLRSPYRATNRAAHRGTQRTPRTRFQQGCHLLSTVSAAAVNSAAVNSAAQSLHISIVGAGVLPPPG